MRVLGQGGEILQRLAGEHVGAVQDHGTAGAFERRCARRPYPGPTSSEARGSVEWSVTGRGSGEPYARMGEASGCDGGAGVGGHRGGGVFVGWWRPGQRARAERVDGGAGPRPAGDLRGGGPEGPGALRRREQRRQRRAGRRPPRRRRGRRTAGGVAGRVPCRPTDEGPQTLRAVHPPGTRFWIPRGSGHPRTFVAIAATHADDENQAVVHFVQDAPGTPWKAVFTAHAWVGDPPASASPSPERQAIPKLEDVARDASGAARTAPPGRRAGCANGTRLCCR